MRIAQTLRQRSAVLAPMITAEMGKPLAEAAAEIEKCAICCRFTPGARSRF